MGKFSDIEAGMPPDHVVVPPEAWSSTWEERPLEDVALGLRFIPDQDLEDARIEAYRRAKALFPDFENDAETRSLFAASFTDGLVRFVIARGTCDPNDVHKPWQGWKAAPEDMAMEVLSDIGGQLIFDRWERMRIAADISLPTATDDDLEALPELLRNLDSLDVLSRARYLRCLRLLRFVLEELTDPDVLKIVEARLDRSNPAPEEASP